MGYSDICFPIARRRELWAPSYSKANLRITIRKACLQGYSCAPSGPDDKSGGSGTTGKFSRQRQSVYRKPKVGTKAP